MAMCTLLTLGFLSRQEDVALLAMRLVTGWFIATGVWDNMTDPQRMHEFVEFMRANGFFWPGFWGPFSVYTQLIAALLIMLGLLTRWGGLIFLPPLSSRWGWCTGPSHCASNGRPLP